MPIVAARSCDGPALRRLLTSAGLLTEDIRDDRLGHFLVLRDGESVVGAIGIDLAEDSALLRSLVVAEPFRGCGLAKELVSAAESLARQKGVKTLYLLTTTAESFFTKYGYRSAPREDAPSAIAAMPQFSSLCPSTSAFMSKPMTSKPFNVLFLCTGNSARSILAEAAMNNLGLSMGKFKAYSAGSHPKGAVNPLALELLRRSHLSTEGLRSKSWDEFAQPGAPPLDFVFTVCDQAAGEQCPYWPGQPMTAHWGMPDPAAVEGSDEQKRKAFSDTLLVLRRRIELFASLPFDKLDRLALHQRVGDIGAQ